ncbi:MAG: replication initiator protein A, partial [Eubacterium sp.]|nr:replication initiator protein A [Eubacterium sp.]
MEGLNLDYFYGMQAELFSFIRIPKILIKDGRFEKMSNDAKMLFGLLLDRMSLSMKNQWFDDENRVYIIYTKDEIMVDLCVASEKCTKLLKELDNYGLIERRKQGFSKPDIIYVKNFATLVDDGNELPKEMVMKVKKRREKKKNNASTKETVEDEYADKTVESTVNTSVVRKSNHEKFENRTTRNSKIEPREIRISNHEKFENRTTRNSKIETREVRKSNPNNTDINNTDYSDTDSSILSNP